MKRSLQEYVELVVFGLIALLVGTGLLWLLGWVLSLGGIVLKGLAGLLWMLLRFVVPVAIAGGLVYFLVKAAQDRQRPATVSPGGGAGVPPPPAPGVIDVAPADAAAAPQHVGDAVDAAVATATEDAVEAVDAVGAAVGDMGSDMGEAIEDAAEAAVTDLDDTIEAVAEDSADGIAAGDDVDVTVYVSDDDADSVSDTLAHEDDENETNA